MTIIDVSQHLTRRYPARSKREDGSLLGWREEWKIDLLSSKIWRREGFDLGGQRASLIITMRARSLLDPALTRVGFCGSSEKKRYLAERYVCTSRTKARHEIRQISGIPQALGTHPATVFGGKTLLYVRNRCQKPANGLGVSSISSTWHAHLVNYTNTTGGTRPTRPGGPSWCPGPSV